MKKQFILGFLLLNLVIFTKDIEINQLEKREELLYEKGEKEAFTGIVREYYNNGNLKTEEEYENGERNGISKTYSRGGSLIDYIEFKKGLVNGSRKVYYDSEKLWFSQEYQNGYLNGKMFNYEEDGSLSSEMEFKLGIPDGLDKTYYKNGLLSKEGTYKNGKKIGIWKSYNENGELIEEKEYPLEYSQEEKEQLLSTVELVYDFVKLKYYEKNKNIPFTGTSKMYYDNGNLNNISTYEDGIKIQESWYEYFENGKKSSENFRKGDIYESKHYSDGKVTYYIKQNFKEDMGEDIRYYDNGQLKSIERYVGLTMMLRKVEGFQEEYYENGNLRIKAETKNNLYNGSYETYYSNGQLYEKGQCKKGEKIGDWKIYLESGELKEIKKYK